MTSATSTREASIDDLVYPVITFYPSYISPPLDRTSQMKVGWRLFGSEYENRMAASGRYRLLDSSGTLYRMTPAKLIGRRQWIFRLLGMSYLAPGLILLERLDLEGFRRALVAACRSRSKSDGGNYDLEGAIVRIANAADFESAIRCIPKAF